MPFEIRNPKKEYDQIDIDVFDTETRKRLEVINFQDLKNSVENGNECFYLSGRILELVEWVVSLDESTKTIMELEGQIERLEEEIDYWEDEYIPH